MGSTYDEHSTQVVDDDCIQNKDCVRSVIMGISSPLLSLPPPTPHLPNRKIPYPFRAQLRHPSERVLVGRSARWLKNLFAGAAGASAAGAGAVSARAFSVVAAAFALGLVDEVVAGAGGALAGGGAVAVGVHGDGWLGWVGCLKVRK